MPTEAKGIEYYLKEENIIEKHYDGFFEIKILGDFLFEKKLTFF